MWPPPGAVTPVDLESSSSFLFFPYFLLHNPHTNSTCRGRTHLCYSPRSWSSFQFPCFPSLNFQRKKKLGTKVKKSIFVGSECSRSKRLARVQHATQKREDWKWHLLTATFFLQLQSRKSHEIQSTVAVLTLHTICRLHCPLFLNLDYLKFHDFKIYKPLVQKNFLAFIPCLNDIIKFV